MTFKPSPACIALIQGYEKCERRQPDGSLHAYMPTPEDVPTIGWGSTGPDIHMDTVWTQEQADERFAHDLAGFAAGVETLLAGAPTTQAQYDAMVSLSYNIGLANFGGSTVLRRHKAGDHAGAKAAFALWNKQGRKVLNGLVARRAREAALYAS